MIHFSGVGSWHEKSVRSSLAGKIYLADSDPKDSTSSELEDMQKNLKFNDPQLDAKMKKIMQTLAEEIRSHHNELSSADIQSSELGHCRMLVLNLTNPSPSNRLSYGKQLREFASSFLVAGISCVVISTQFGSHWIQPFYQELKKGKSIGMALREITKNEKLETVQDWLSNLYIFGPSSTM